MKCFNLNLRSFLSNCVLTSLTIATLSFVSCNGKQAESINFESSEEQQKPTSEERTFPNSLENGKFIEKDGKKLLYGGLDSSWHFDITNSILIDSQYHFGIGRERFDALINPEFISMSEADLIYADSAKFLFLAIDGEARAYGIDMLTRHEVVNDRVGNKKVAAAYCILANLGAVYSREYGDTSLTFALSGYTYSDPEVWDGLDGFIWWDRETESTWWPLIGQGVSGSFNGTPLKVLDHDLWSQTTWKEIKAKYTGVLVLKPGQTMDPPSKWRRFDQSLVESIRSTESKKVKIAPEWGGNP